MRNLIILTCLMASLLACYPVTKQSREQMLIDLFNAKPKLDASAAIAVQDYRFIAVMNHTLAPPMNMPQCLIDKFGYRIMSNEALEYMSYDFQMYGAMTVIYANWYNYEILSTLEALEEYPCPADPKQEH